MKYLAAIFALMVWPTLAASPPVSVSDQSFRDADGKRVLKETVVVAAPVAVGAAACPRPSPASGRDRSRRSAAGRGCPRCARK